MSDAGGSSIRVLHVDDNPDLTEVVSMHLERADDRLDVATETSARDALERLEDGEDVDCIVSDHDMPGMDGLEFLQEVRRRWPDLPFILFTGKGSEEIASQAISEGVTEYLQKGTGSHQYTVLANRIQQAVEVERAKAALEESERMLSTLISNLPGMVYRCRNERGWPMHFVSEGCEELTGHPPEAIESGDVNWGEDIVVEADREGLWDRVQTALDAHKPFEVTYRIRTAEDEERWVWERGTGVFEDNELIALEGFITDITARKQRERELRDQQEFIERLLDTLGDPFYLVSPEGELLRWNERVTEVTGYSDAELSGLGAEALLAEEDLEEMDEVLAAAKEHGRTTIEVDILTREDERVPFEMHVAPLYDSEEDLIGVVGVGRDLTDRLERERRLEQYRTLVENVGDPMYVLGPEGRIEMVNNALVEHLGHEREAIVGATPAMFLPEVDMERGQAIVEDLLESDDQWRTWEMEAIRADGTRFLNETRTAVIHDEDGEFAGTVGVIRDIEERKQRELELQRFETIIQAVGDPVYALDEDGVITFANDAFEQLSGYTVEELEGEHISLLVPESDVSQGREYIREMIDGERDTVTYEISVERKDGGTVPCELHIAMLPFDDEFRGTAGIIRDITERKEREERLEEFASVVSHDIRSPLNVIMGRIEMALETGDREHLETIQDSAERMDTLVEDLLSLAQQGETVGETSQVQLQALLEAAWETVDTREATLRADLDWRLEADPERLRELFENLLRNAVEHGGEAVMVTVGTLRDGEGFYIADDGPGVPPEDREQVFERGYSGTDEGTGFGLAIVSRIAEAHGWTVDLTESEAGGARFEFRT